MDIDKEYEELYGGDQQYHDILNLDNELTNLWIRVYYKLYFPTQYFTLSNEWKKEMIDDCKQCDQYFDWFEIKSPATILPKIKDGIVLSNKECAVLERIIENYSGLKEFYIGQIVDECLNNETKTQYFKEHFKNYNYPACMNTLEFYVPVNCNYDFVGESIRNHLEDTEFIGRIKIEIRWYRDDMNVAVDIYEYDYTGCVDYISESLRDSLEEKLIRQYQKGLGAIIKMCQK